MRTAESVVFTLWPPGPWRRGMGGVAQSLGRVRALPRLASAPVSDRYLCAGLTSGCLCPRPQPRASPARQLTGGMGPRVGLLARAPDAPLRWRCSCGARPLDSVVGTRCTRCTPDSCFKSPVRACTSRPCVCRPLRQRRSASRERLTLAADAYRTPSHPVALGAGHSQRGPHPPLDDT